MAPAWEGIGIFGAAAESGLGFVPTLYMLTTDVRRPQDVVGFPFFWGRQWGFGDRDRCAARLRYSRRD